MTSESVTHLSSSLPAHSETPISLYTSPRGLSSPASAGKRSLEPTSSSLDGRKDGTAPPFSKRLRVLRTSFNTDTSHEVRAHTEKKMLHLARISREVHTAKIHYQRLRMRELEMMQSIMEDQLEASQVSLSDTERQIGEIRQHLFGGGGLAGSTGSTEQWTRILQVDASSHTSCSSDDGGSSSYASGSTHDGNLPCRSCDDSDTSST